MLKSRLIPQQIIVFLIFTFLIFTAMCLQTTVWFSFFGFFPSPCFWAPFFVYLVMNRPLPKNFIWLMWFYLIFMTQTSAVPLTLFLALSSLWGIIMFFQHRVSTLGMFDLIVFSAGSVVVYPVLYYIFSVMGEGLVSIDIVNIIVSLFLSIPFIPAALFICKKIDSTFDPLNNNSDNLVLDI